VEDSQSRNILTSENVLSPLKLTNAGLTENQGEFLFKTLVDVFREIRIPVRGLITGDKEADHPVVWMLLDPSGEDLRLLFNLCIELSITKQIPNHEAVFERLRSANDYVGARAEVHIGSWIRTATKDVHFVLPDGKQKTTDFEARIGGRSVYVEVKGNSETDFEVGMKMFEGWVRSRLIEIFSKDNFKRVVRFGAYWIDGIGAACNIDPEIENASWAFHSAISSLVTQACYIIGNKVRKNAAEVVKIEPDIEIVKVGEVQRQEPPVILELPRSNRVASIGNIIKKLTSKENIEKFQKGEGIFAFYTREAIDEIIGRQLLDTLLLQCPQLNRTLHGVAIFNSEGVAPIFIHTFHLDASEKEKAERIWLPDCFKNPVWDESRGSAVIP
jgi:hypothetical protein